MVAIKVLKSQLVASGELRARFEREAVCLPKHVCYGPSTIRTTTIQRPIMKSMKYFSLTRPGMFWTVRGANGIIALRCCQLSGKFEEYCEAPTGGSLTLMPHTPHIVG